MRRLLTWALVSFGIAAVARRLRRRVRHEELSPPADDPAAELRQKLADSRVDEETPAGPPVSPEASVEDRRASVHEEGRATVDDMRGPDGSDET
jgi:hypothetical protein